MKMKTLILTSMLSAVALMAQTGSAPSTPNSTAAPANKTAPAKVTKRSHSKKAPVTGSNKQAAGQTDASKAPVQK
jgi:hypothetical protein